MRTSAPPLVSVIIPTFNRAAAVCRAVQSVLGQTYTRLEVIVVDDGSTDDTLARLTEFGSAIRVVSARNGGASAARNRGIDAASGDVIAFLDSDDLWMPRKVEMQLQALEMLGSDYGACFTDCRYAGNAELTSSPFEEAGLDSVITFAPLDSPFRWILGRFTPMYIQSLLVRRAVVAAAGGLDERLTVGEDTDFFFRMAFHTKLCFVRDQLVEIDRTPSRPHGLMELYHEGSDRMYASRTLMLRKWLALPQLSDPSVRRDIETFLRDTLYDRAVNSLYRRSLRETFLHAREIRTTGDAFVHIAWALARRVLRRGAKAAMPAVLPQFSSASGAND